MEQLVARIKMLEEENAQMKKKVESDKLIMVKKEEKFPVFKINDKQLGPTEWYAEVVDYLESSGLTEAEKAQFLKSHITGDAYVDILNKLPRAELKKPESILAAFKLLFCDALSNDEFLKQLWCFKQKSHESIAEYARNLLSLHRKVQMINETDKLSTEAIKSIFIRGISCGDLRMQLNTLSESSGMSFEKLTRYATNFEAEYTTRSNPQANSFVHEASSFETTIESMQKTLRELSLKIDQMSSTRNCENYEVLTNNSRKNFKCFNCGKQGHLKRDCYAKKNYNRQEYIRGRDSKNFPSTSGN